MKITGYWLQRRIAHCIVMFLVVPFGAPLPLQAAATQQVDSAPPAPSPAPNSDNNKPDAGTSQSGASPESTRSLRTRPKSDGDQSGSAQSATESQQNGGHQPVGTAAAPYENTIGVAASRPAGAAIAPAKQRRTRSILIKVGLILGVGVAIGTVVALSHASPSRSQ